MLPASTSSLAPLASAAHTSVTEMFSVSARAGAWHKRQSKARSRRRVRAGRAQCRFRRQAAPPGTCLDPACSLLAGCCCMPGRNPSMPRHPHPAGRARRMRAEAQLAVHPACGAPTRYGAQARHRDVDEELRLAELVGLALLVELAAGWVGLVPCRRIVCKGGGGNVCSATRTPQPQHAPAGVPQWIDTARGVLAVCTVIRCLKASNPTMCRERAQGVVCDAEAPCAARWPIHCAAASNLPCRSRCSRSTACGC